MAMECIEYEYERYISICVQNMGGIQSIMFFGGRNTWNMRGVSYLVP